MYLIYEKYDDFAGGGIIPSHVVGGEEEAYEYCKTETAKLIIEEPHLAKFLGDNALITDDYHGYAYMEIFDKPKPKINHE